MNALPWIARAARALAALALFVVSMSGTRLDAVDSTTAKKLFARPPREYSSAPLWVWNDMLTEKQVRESMRDLAAQHVKQVFVHPRPGLMTPYLGPDWFRLWRVALDEAERLDMNVWIYDENSYPSGFAGGWVPELMPESRGRGLLLREAKTPPSWSSNHVAVYSLGDNAFENVSSQVQGGGSLPEGRYLVASIRRADNSPWHGGRCYVDLLYPGVTEKFLEVTMEPYRREIGGQFGIRVPGVFTDEPELRPAGGFPWTDGLPAEFQKRWGYSLVDILPSLNLEVGDWRKARHNYLQVVHEQFVEHWGKPYFNYCASNRLEFTGHYWEHEWPRCLMVPDNMAMYAWHQRPSIDILMNQYSEGTHDQFGNARAVKELSSVANQLGRARTLCEAYGAGGWDLRFEDMKRIGDWLFVLGVNTMDEHLSYITLRGARKRDHPQSFSYHEPWWPAYGVSASYFERLTAAMCQGEQINKVLVLEPTTSAWLYQAEAQNHPRLAELGGSFQQLVLNLERAQIEYDLGCEDILAAHASISGAELRVGRRNYHTLVLPPFTENLNSPTAKLIEDFLGAGGAVWCCGEPPSRVDGAASERLAALAKKPGWKMTEAQALPGLLRQLQEQSGFVLAWAETGKGKLFHHRRQLNDGQLLFLVNTSIEAAAVGVIEARCGGLEQWDLSTGKTSRFPFEPRNQGMRARFELPPSGSLLLFMSDKTPKALRAVETRTTTIKHAAGPEARRIEPNVLTLDYVDVTAAGETKTNLYFYKANQFAFQKNGMDRNPWDSAVQFRDELITKKFPPESGFEVAYRFVIEEKVPVALSIVIERPDLYTITCNDRPVKIKKGAWWLDKAFGRIDISRLARVGENAVKLKASPFTIFHEIEPAYLLGEFSLKPAASGFVVAPPREVQMGAWNGQGMPFYAAGVLYRERFDLTRLKGAYHVQFASWYGSVAKVEVNGKFAGWITAPPWRCDVTSHLRNGQNLVEVTVIGTLKNTLGPHHNNPGLGLAWPGMFQTGPSPGPPPGASYHTVGYGLFEPFTLQQTIEVEQRAAR